MSFASAAAAPVQAIGLSATIGGVALTTLVEATATAGRQQQVSTCELTCLTLQSLSPGAEVIVTITINGESATLFRGRYEDYEVSWDGSGRVVLRCRGLLAKLQDKWGGVEDRVYDTALTDDERHDGAVIRNLIEATGVPSSRHSIVDSVLLDSTGSPGVWLLGEIQPVTLPIGTAPLELVNRIDEVAGYRTADDLDGIIRRSEFAPAGAESVADWSFTEGVNGVRIRRTRQHVGVVVNKWKVSGLTFQGIPVEYEHAEVNTLLDSLVAPELRPYYTSDTFSSELIETDNHCQRTAEHKVSFTSRPVDEHEILLETARSDIKLADTCQLTYPAVGTSGRVQVVYLQVRVSAETGAASTTIRTNGGTLV